MSAVTNKDKKMLKSCLFWTLQILLIFSFFSLLSKKILPLIETCQFSLKMNLTCLGTLELGCSLLQILSEDFHTITALSCQTVFQRSAQEQQVHTHTAAVVSYHRSLTENIGA